MPDSNINCKKEHLMLNVWINNNFVLYMLCGRLDIVVYMTGMYVDYLID